MFYRTRFGVEDVLSSVVYLKNALIDNSLSALEFYGEKVTS